MFDGIIKNTLTDVIRGIMFAIAGDLGLTGTTSQQFVAGGLAVFAGVWAWYENKGHQLIVNALKAHTGTSSLSVALKIPPTRS